MLAEAQALAEFIAAELHDPKVLASSAIGLLPVIGDLYDLSVALSGYDAILDQQVEFWERGLAVVGVVAEPASAAPARAAALAMREGRRLHRVFREAIKAVAGARIPEKLTAETLSDAVVLNKALRLPPAKWAPNTGGVIHNAIGVDGRQHRWLGCDACVYPGRLRDYGIVIEAKSGRFTDTAKDEALAQVLAYKQNLEREWGKTFHRVVAWLDEEGHVTIVHRDPGVTDDALRYAGLHP